MKKYLGYRSGLTSRLKNQYYNTQIKKYRSNVADAGADCCLSVHEVERFPYGRIEEGNVGYFSSEVCVAYRVDFRRGPFLVYNGGEFAGGFLSFAEAALFVAALGYSVSYEDGHRDGSYNGDFIVWWNALEE